MDFVYWYPKPATQPSGTGAISRLIQHIYHHSFLMSCPPTLLKMLPAVQPPFYKLPFCAAPVAPRHLGLTSTLANQPLSVDHSGLDVYLCVGFSLSSTRIHIGG